MRIWIIALLVGFGGISTVSAQTAIGAWKVNSLMQRVNAPSDTLFVVNFWATFCKPCIEEIPDLEAVVAQQQGRPVKLLLVSVDQKSFFPAKLEQFVRERGYQSEVLWLNETNADYFCPLVDKSWSGAIPATLILSHKKSAREFIEAPLEKLTFERYLNQLR